MYQYSRNEDVWSRVIDDCAHTCRSIQFDDIGSSIQFDELGRKEGELSGHAMRIQRDICSVVRTSAKKVVVKTLERATEVCSQEEIQVRARRERTFF
jgi:hypothetical protein